MKKITFFFLAPTLFLTTVCTAIETVSLTQSQQKQYLSKDWIVTFSGKKFTQYCMLAERPYSNSITATLRYQLISNKITLHYSNSKTGQSYASSSFELPENQQKVSKLNFGFIPHNTHKAIIAVDDTYFTLPIPDEVTNQGNTRK